MNRFDSVTKPLMWFMALLLAAFVAGCGGSNDNSAPGAARAITSYSLNSVSGTIDETAKTIAVTMPNGTNVTALVATFATTGTNTKLKVGAAVQTSGTTANNFTSPVEYKVTAAGRKSATYTVTVTIAAAVSSAKAITAYSLAGVTGTITGTNIAVTLPFGTSTTQIATFTTTGASVKVGATDQTSATTSNSFSSPVAYIVTAADGTTTTYTVTVTVAASSAKAFTAFSLAAASGVPATGTINETAKIIFVTMPAGTDVTALVATFTPTAGVTIGTPAVAQVSGTTANNFTAPVTYRLTAADSTFADYVVTVTVAMNSAKAITAYSLVGASGIPATGTITQPAGLTAGTITVAMPYGTNVTDLNALTATFISTGTGLPKVAGADQSSGFTVNNFTTPKAYLVTAANGTTATYNVSVTIAALAPLNLKRAANFAVLAGGGITNNAITTVITGDVGFGVAGISAPATVNGTSYTVGDPAYDNAIADLPSVIADARSTVLYPCGTTTGGGMGTATFTPGIHCIATDAAISGVVTLTLNGPGVYIFRTAGAFTPSAGSSVGFSNGADNTNTSVFWVVGSSDITSGAPGTFVGTILSDGALTVGDGITLLNGRVLTTAAATLTNNTITIP